MASAGSPARSTNSTLKDDDESEWTGYKYGTDDSSMQGDDDDKTVQAFDEDEEERPLYGTGKGPSALFRSTTPGPGPRSQKRSNSITRRADKRTRKRSRSKSRSGMGFDLATLDKSTTTPANRVRRVKRWMQDNSTKPLNHTNVTDSTESLTPAIKQNFPSRLPVEIWCNIFKLRNDEGEREWEDQSIRKPLFTPLLLSAVCRDWRFIVMNCPLLWLYVAIPQNETLSNNQRDRILYYSTRISPYPPIAYTYEKLRSRATPNDLVTVLQKAFTKYQTFEIRKGPLLPNRFLSLFLEKLSPETETLRLVSWRHTRMIDRDCWSLSGSAVRNVGKISCVGLSVRIQSMPRDPPRWFTRTTSFAIRDTVCFSSDLLDSLENLSAVEHLDLDGTTFRSNHTVRRITIPSLTSLSCNILQYYDMHFFGSTPMLQTLHLRLVEAHHKSHWERFSHLGVGRTAIRALRISSSKDLENSRKGEKIYLDVIQHFENVQTLELGGVFAVLCLRALPTPHIPLEDLSSVTISQSPIDEDVVDAFWSRFQSRHMRSLDIICTGCPNVDNTGRTTATLSAGQ